MFAKREDRLGLHVILSVTTVMFLIVVDNPSTFGRDIIRPGAWIGLTICSVIVLFGQALVREVFLARYTGKHKTLLSSIAGIVLGLVILYSLLFLIRK